MVHRMVMDYVFATSAILGVCVCAQNRTPSRHLHFALAAENGSKEEREQLLAKLKAVIPL